MTVVRNFILYKVAFALKGLLREIFPKNFKAQKSAV